MPKYYNLDSDDYYYVDEETLQIYFVEDGIETPVTYQHMIENTTNKPLKILCKIIEEHLYNALLNKNREQ